VLLFGFYLIFLAIRGGSGVLIKHLVKGIFSFLVPIVKVTLCGFEPIEA
jgi:hypothetical protein